ncbi:MAG: DHHW family protein, partial [Pseudoflavonifractor sp.]
MEPLPLSAYQSTTVSDGFYGTTFSSSGVRNVKPDSIDIYVPDPGVEVTSWFSEKPQPGKLYDWTRLEKKDKYPFFMGGNQSLAVIKNPQVQGPKLLILRDSYTDSLVPFLTAHFSEIHLFDLRYNRNSVPQYIKANGIDMAVMLYSVPNYVTDGNFFTLRQK